MRREHMWREACGIPRKCVQCDNSFNALHHRTPQMTLFTALALLPFAAAMQVSLVIALAKAVDGDRAATGFTGSVPTLA